MINQVKYMHQEAWTGGKEYIVSALFKYLDIDNNGLVTNDELNKVRLLIFCARLISNILQFLVTFETISHREKFINK